MPKHYRSAARKPLIVGIIFLVGLSAAAFITAVAAQHTSATPTVNPIIARLPPEKQTAAALKESKTADYATAHPQVVRILPTETHPPLPLGIQDKYPNWWNTKQRLENEWYGDLNGERVGVYAGVCPTFSGGETIYDLQQGCVSVAVGAATSGPSLNYHEYLTPKKAGSVKITAVSGTRVSLVAKDGTTFTFDLDTRTFS